MTTIISSQRHIDWDIVAEKRNSLAGMTEIELPAYDVHSEDDDIAILADGHHRLVAAKELGIKVIFVVKDHPEGLRGEDLLNDQWGDSDYYDVETGKNYF